MKEFHKNRVSKREALVFNTMLNLAHSCVQIMTDFHNSHFDSVEAAERMELESEKAANVLGYEYREVK